MLSPEIVCSEKFCPCFKLFNCDAVLEFLAYTCAKHGLHNTYIWVQGRVPSEIAGLYKYLCKRFSLPSLLKTHKPEKNTAPSLHNSDIYSGLSQENQQLCLRQSRSRSSVLKAAICPFFTFQHGSSLIPQKTSVLTKH